MNLLMDHNMNVTVLLNQSMLIASKETNVNVTMDGGVAMDGGTGMEGGEGIEGDYMEGTVKDPLLSSLPVVIGISVATIILGLVVGFLLAKRKIKKGIELYED